MRFSAWSSRGESSASGQRKALALGRLAIASAIAEGDCSSLDGGALAISSACPQRDHVPAGRWIERWKSEDETLNPRQGVEGRTLGAKLIEGRFEHEHEKVDRRKRVDDERHGPYPVHISQMLAFAERGKLWQSTHHVEGTLGGRRDVGVLAVRSFIGGSSRVCADVR